MKKITSLIIILISTLSHAQSSIASFFGTTDFYYTNLSPTVALDHSTTGANVSWDFQNIPTNGTSVETNTLPTATELSTYPNTTSVHRITTTINSPNNTANIFSNTSGSTFSFTGFDSNGIVLNYITNNATVGAFPLNFGFSNTDTLAGNYIYSTYNGSFTGTITTEYDSYGTLNLGVDGYNPISKTVSRIKQVQNINLNYSLFTNIGTILETTYTYYADNNGVMEPFFRDTTYVVNVPTFGFNQTTNQDEVFTSALIPLSVSNFDLLSKDLILYPNPTLNKLTISNEANYNIESIVIIDVNGAKLLETKNSSTIDISHFASGIYFVQINTDEGTITKKIIKE